MHMQRQHRQRDADDQKSDQDDAHDRQQCRDRTAVRGRVVSAPRMFHTLGYSDCARPFGLNLIRSVRGIALARRLYRLILKHEHNYRDCPTMRLASKVRMNLSDRRNNNPWEHPGNGPNSATVYQDRSTASAPARFRRAKRTASDAVDGSSTGT
jgi:hypothetical protein